MVRDPAERVVRLAILDSYGVEWPLETFARDVLQNFFDATPDFRDVAMADDRAARTLEIRGPAEFDLDLLSYVGATTKRDGTTAGGFGEGFKVCALLALRDFKLEMRAGSGAQEIQPFFDPVTIGRELCYRARTRSDKTRGSFVRFEKVSDECFEAFARAKDHFFYEGNPHIGKLVAQGDGVAVYVSTIKRTGELYYRRQKRGETLFRSYAGKYPALTFACHEADDALEGDRDRRELEATAVARAVAKRLAPEGILRTMLLMMEYWKYGHEALAAFLSVAAERELKFEFPKLWLARTGKREGLSELASRQGYALAVADFADVGMPTAHDIFSFDLETRPPTEIESARLSTLATLYTRLLGTDNLPEKPFEVFDSGRAAIQGQHLGDRVIIASKHLTTGAFPAAAATVLHELAHEAGGETSDAFQNRLTRLLASSFRNQTLIRKARREFDAASAPPLMAQPNAPYAPENDFDVRSEDPDAIDCLITVPRAFPPTEELVRAIVSNAEALGIAVNVTAIASHYKDVAGVPTFDIGGHDVVKTRARRGYRLRTYARGAIRPTDAQIRRALLAARERAKVPAAPKRKPKPLTPAQRAAYAARDVRNERDATLEYWLHDWAEKSLARDARGLSRIWWAGVHISSTACAKKLEAEDDEADAGTIWKRVHERIAARFELARQLRRDDTTFEDGDDFETSAMEAAQAACIVAYEERGEAYAKRAFAVVRELGAIITRDDIADVLRNAVMVHALERAGLSIITPRAGPIDLEKLRDAFDAARAAARVYQSELDDECACPHAQTLFGRLETFHQRDDEQDRERTHRVKHIYEKTLARTGSVAAAARAAVSAAKGLSH